MRNTIGINNSFKIFFIKNKGHGGKTEDIIIYVPMNRNRKQYISKKLLIPQERRMYIIP